jgi:hypothetical protein
VGISIVEIVFMGLAVTIITETDTSISTMAESTLILGQDKR